MPVLGVVYIPAEKCTYAAAPGTAFKMDESGRTTPLQVVPPHQGDTIIVMGSRSHSTPEVDAYVHQLQGTYREVVFQSAGSSLKFCRIAEGKAHRYPRLGPTMEWDTAAGHAVVLQAGGMVSIAGTNQPLTYNKENLLNPFFEVSAG
jgi:3'(2'), 5'-bisphosphate nucleotidase